MKPANIVQSLRFVVEHEGHAVVASDPVVVECVTSKNEGLEPRHNWPLDDVRACYDQLLRKDDYAAGTATMSVVVGTSGVVGDEPWAWAAVEAPR